MNVGVLRIRHEMSATTILPLSTTHTTRIMHRTILGIDGTAWNLSAGKGDRRGRPRRGDCDVPAKDRRHLREAAQHHATHIASVIRKAIKSAGDVEIDGIAFSQGPGMGPCLRTVATAARALALSLDVPLTGVNHCVAHLETGRWQCGIDDPVMLYVSGANSQVLAYRQRRRCSILKMSTPHYRGERYRIFGSVPIYNSLS